MYIGRTNRESTPTNYPYFLDKKLAREQFLSARVNNAHNLLETLFNGALTVQSVRTWVLKRISNTPWWNKSLKKYQACRRCRKYWFWKFLLTNWWKIYLFNELCAKPTLFMNENKFLSFRYTYEYFSKFCIVFENFDSFISIKKMQFPMITQDSEKIHTYSEE